MNDPKTSPVEIEGTLSLLTNIAYLDIQDKCELKLRRVYFAMKKSIGTRTQFLLKDDESLKKRGS